MNAVINFLAKYSGAGFVWDKLDGYKLYGTGALAVLGALVGLGSELAPILASHNTALLFTFLTHVNSDPSYLALLAGFGTIAAAHKADKMAEGLSTAPVPAPASSPVVLVPPAVGSSGS